LADERDPRSGAPTFAYCALISGHGVNVKRKRTPDGRADIGRVPKVRFAPP
jgi:hypothetical protein